MKQVTKVLDSLVITSGNLKKNKEHYLHNCHGIKLFN